MPGFIKSVTKIQCTVFFKKTAPVSKHRLAYCTNPLCTFSCFPPISTPLFPFPVFDMLGANQFFHLKRVPCTKTNSALTFMRK